MELSPSAFTLNCRPQSLRGPWRERRRSWGNACPTAASSRAQTHHQSTRIFEFNHRNGFIRQEQYSLANKCSFSSAHDGWNQAWREAPGHAVRPVGFTLPSPPRNYLTSHLIRWTYTAVHYIGRLIYSACFEPQRPWELNTLQLNHMQIQKHKQIQRRTENSPDKNRNAVNMA